MDSILTIGSHFNEFVMFSMEILPEKGLMTHYMGKIEPEIEYK